MRFRSCRQMNTQLFTQIAAAITDGQGGFIEWRKPVLQGQCRRRGVLLTILHVKAYLDVWRMRCSTMHPGQDIRLSNLSVRLINTCTGTAKRESNCHSVEWALWNTDVPKDCWHKAARPFNSNIELPVLLRQHITRNTGNSHIARCDYPDNSASWVLNLGLQIL